MRPRPAARGRVLAARGGIAGQAITTPGRPSRRSQGDPAAGVGARAGRSRSPGAWSDGSGRLGARRLVASSLAARQELRTPGRVRASARAGGASPPLRAGADSGRIGNPCSPARLRSSGPGGTTTGRPTTGSSPTTPPRDRVRRFHERLPLKTLPAEQPLRRRTPRPRAPDRPAHRLALAVRPRDDRLRPRPLSPRFAGRLGTDGGGLPVRRPGSRSLLLPPGRGLGAARPSPWAAA